MQAWLDGMCESDDRPDGYMHPDMAEHMATAASAVFDATFRGQEYAEHEV